MIPGLIDNHNHVVRATEYWPNEARLDGVTSRARALELLRAKAERLAADEWLMTLGGWTESQFVGDQSDFTLSELDANGVTGIDVGVSQKCFTIAQSFGRSAPKQLGA